MEVLKLTSALEAESPELEYALSHVLLQARRIDRESRLTRMEEGVVAPHFEGSCEVLVIGPGAHFVGAVTLRLLREALLGGAAAAVPHQLAELDLGEREVLTQRAFERLEEEFVEGRIAPPETGRVNLLPLSLLAAEHYAAYLAGRPLTGEFLEAALPAPERFARAGLAHQFIDYYGEVRDDILPFVPAGISEVLEVGCGRGLTGALLQDLFGCRVTGVELNPQVAREAATRLHAVICGDVANVVIDGEFDVVLALELFEHLPRAEEVLMRLADQVRPGGRIILSVPNVGHASVVEDLLAGRWDYLPIGLLCYTHYRFFTRQTLADWLLRCGFERFELVAQQSICSSALETLEGIELDRENLRTKGFYVLIDLPR